MHLYVWTSRDIQLQPSLHQPSTASSVDMIAFVLVTRHQSEQLRPGVYSKVSTRSSFRSVYSRRFARLVTCVEMAGSSGGGRAVHPGIHFTWLTALFRGFRSCHRIGTALSTARCYSTRAGSWRYSG